MAKSERDLMRAEFVSRAGWGDAGERSLIPGLGAYTGDALIEAAMLLPEWYLPEATGKPTDPEETARYVAVVTSTQSRLGPFLRVRALLRATSRG